MNTIQPVILEHVEAAWLATWGPLDANDRVECADVVRMTKIAAGRPSPRNVRERAHLSVAMHEHGLSWAVNRWWCLFGAPPSRRAVWRFACAWCAAWATSAVPMALRGRDAQLALPL